MNNLISKIFRNFKNKYCIPQEDKEYVINKQLKHLSGMMITLSVFAVLYMVFLIISSNKSGDYDIRKFLFYIFLLVCSLLIGVVSFAFKGKGNEAAYNVVNFLTLIMMSFLSIYTTTISTTDISNCVYFNFIVIIIGITFFYFNPLYILIVSLIAFIRLIFIYTGKGLSVCAFNSCLSIIVINLLSFYKTKTSYENLRKSRQLKNQNYRLNEQTIELSAQQDELLKLKNRLEDTVETQAGKLQSQNEKIIHLQDHTIKTLSNLVERRDNETGLHVFRTSAYVKMLGEEAFKNGLYPETITLQYISKIESAAALHDVGKIVVSDTVLKKPGRLTPEEFEQIKLHTTEGGKIVSSVLSEQDDAEYVKYAVEIATYHHEKWDGTGYPEGLKGNDIPLSARIMAIADVFDALVSKRCYKDALSIDEALEIIKNESGSHFDSNLADVFINCRTQITSIMEQYSEDKKDI